MAKESVNVKYILIALAILIAMAFLLIAVATSDATVDPAPTPQQVDYIVFVHDDAHQVGCWLNQTGTAISCIPDPERCETIEVTQTVRARFELVPVKPKVVRVER